MRKSPKRPVRCLNAEERRLEKQILLEFLKLKSHCRKHACMPHAAAAAATAAIAGRLYLTPELLVLKDTQERSSNYHGSCNRTHNNNS